MSGAASASALREIAECLIQLASAERIERITAVHEGRAIPVIVGNAEVASKLRREALDEIERIVDRALVLGVSP